MSWRQHRRHQQTFLRPDGELTPSATSTSSIRSPYLSIIARRGVSGVEPGRRNLRPPAHELGGSSNLTANGLSRNCANQNWPLRKKFSRSQQRGQEDPAPPNRCLRLGFARRSPLRTSGEFSVTLQGARPYPRTGRLTKMLPATSKRVRRDAADPKLLRATLEVKSPAEVADSQRGRAMSVQLLDGGIFDAIVSGSGTALDVPAQCYCADPTVFEGEIEREAETQDVFVCDRPTWGATMGTIAGYRKRRT